MMKNENQKSTDPYSKYVVTKGDYNLLCPKNGPVLGYSPQSGIKIIEVDGYFFKDFSGTGTLEGYADWRLPMEERAKDLASKLSIEEIAGLMLYSPQNKLPMADDTYGGKNFEKSGANPFDLSDSQIKFLTEDNLRHILLSKIDSPETAARWNNKIQALVESRMHGIPANNSSDPRHSAIADAEFSAGNGGKISMWSSTLGLAATFDPKIILEFGKVASSEYRALGLATALSPQADLGTEPRWYRYSSTFGPDPKLVTDLTRAYCDGFQTSENGDEIEDGWGYNSVNAMVKHWPGGGSGEGGRDAHYGNGKFAVYPGGNYHIHKIPFLEGAFNLKGKTKMASAVMPYYTISYNQTNENVANGFNKDIITDQLRKDAGFDGVVCTDWLITHDEIHPGVHSGKPWGVELMDEVDRHYKALIAGVDQFGGNNKKEPILKAYLKGVQMHGEKWMRNRFEQSAYRLLINIFRTGLFENPYVDVEKTKETVGCPSFMNKGYKQQLQSIVMLKNKASVMPLKKDVKVFIPQRTVPAGPNFWRMEQPEKNYHPVSDHMLSQYFPKSNSAEDADVAIVFIESPHSLYMGYDCNDAKSGGNGYIPISLQYKDYVAEYARETSIAGGDPFEPFVNRTYRNKKAVTINKCDLYLLEQTRKQMGNKPIIAVIALANPLVMHEIEPLVDGILIDFDVQKQAILDVISGKYEPSGLLPLQLPADMKAVEEHFEDTPRDIRCYKDCENNIYDFAFGLNWKGIIDDDRTRYYN